MPDFGLHITSGPYCTRCRRQLLFVGLFSHVSLWPKNAKLTTVENVVDDVGRYLCDVMS